MIVVSCSRQVWSIKQYIMSVSDKQWVTQIATSAVNPFIYHKLDSQKYDVLF